MARAFVRRGGSHVDRQEGQETCRTSSRPPSGACGGFATRRGRRSRNRRPSRLLGRRLVGHLRRAIPPASRNAVTLVQPTAQVEQPATLAAKGHRRALPRDRTACRKSDNEQTPLALTPCHGLSAEGHGGLGTLSVARSPSSCPVGRRFFPCSSPCPSWPAPSAAAAGRLVGRGRLLVRLAAVVGLVEARSLENDRRPGADQPPQLQLAALRDTFAWAASVIEWKSSNWCWQASQT